MEKNKYQKQYDGTFVNFDEKELQQFKAERERAVRNQQLEKRVTRLEQQLQKLLSQVT